MDKSEKEKLQGDPFIRGTPTLSWIFPPGALTSPHSKYQRKIQLEPPAGRGEKKPI